jgi:hypothetical protein
VFVSVLVSVGLRRVASACSSAPLEPTWNTPTDVLSFEFKARRAPPSAVHSTVHSRSALDHSFDRSRLHHLTRLYVICGDYYRDL